MLSYFWLQFILNEFNLKWMFGLNWQYFNLFSCPLVKLKVTILKLKYYTMMIFFFTKCILRIWLRQLLPLKRIKISSIPIIKPNRHIAHITYFFYVNYVAICLFLISYGFAVTIPLIIKTTGEFIAFEFTVIDLVNVPTLLVL